MNDQLPFESELIARIGWLIRLRWLAVLGATLAVGLGAAWFRGKLALGPLLAVTAAVALYNLQFALYFRTLKIGPSGSVRLHHATLFAYVQIGLDLLALEAWIYFSGGVENPMALFFVFHVIIASILLQRRVSYVVAALASLLYTSGAVLEQVGRLPHHPLLPVAEEAYREPLYLLFSTSILAIALFLVAYLTTSITTRLRERDRELMESNLSCQFRSTELEQLNEQLRRIDGERTRFMVLVTHELRAPISTIYSTLELVLSGYASAEKTREVLERAQDRARELLSLIGDLLDLSKVREQSVRKDAAGPTDLAVVLKEVVEFMKVEAAGKGLSVEADVAPSPVMVQALPEHMKLVWTNLLSNAIKYNKPQGSIRVSLVQDAEKLIGRVEDTGIGIAPEDLTRIFDEFYRASNARSVSPLGTGVGLAIVRRIVENYGGEITVESEPGRGSIFTLVLPRWDGRT